MTGITIKVATDLYRAKVNYIVDFPTLPTVHALKAKLEALFTRDVETKRPPGVPLSIFKIDHIQIFEAASGSWVELDSSALLTEGCQLYVFQPPSALHDDTQSGLPPATRPPPLHAEALAAATVPLAAFSPSPLRTVVAPPVSPPLAAAAPALASPLLASTVAAVAADAAINANVVLGDLVESTHYARVATAEAASEVVEANHRLAVQESFAQDAARSANAADAQFHEAQRKSLAAREQFTASVSGVEAVKSSERVAVMDHARLVNHMQAAETLAHAQEAELSRAQHRLTEIARLVAQQRAEVEHQRDLGVKAVVDVEASQSRVAQADAALEAAKSSVADGEKQLAEANEAAEVAEAKEKDASASLEEATAAAAAARDSVSAAMQAFTNAKEGEGLKRQDQVEAQHTVALAQQRHMAQEEETAKMELKLKEVEGLFKMQELEVQRHHELSERCKQELDAAKEGEAAAGEAALEAQRAVHKAEDELMEAERVLEKALAAERDANVARMTAQGEVDRTAAIVAGCEAGLKAAREHEELATADVEAAKAGLAASEARKLAQDAELAAAEERLAELEKLQVEQTQDVDRSRGEAVKARAELMQAAESEKQTAHEVALIQTMVTTTQDELLRKQAELAAYQDLENEAASMKLHAQSDRAAQLSLVDATERQLQALREKESVRRAAEEETVRAAELQSHLARSLEREQFDLAARRAALERELSPVPVGGLRFQ